MHGSVLLNLGTILEVHSPGFCSETVSLICSFPDFMMACSLLKFSLKYIATIINFSLKCIATIINLYGLNLSYPRLLLCVSMQKVIPMEEADLSKDV